MLSEAIIEKKARILKANYILKAKVGHGPMDGRSVKRAQEVMDNNSYDYAPLAKQYLSKLEGMIKDTRDCVLPREVAIEHMTEIVMQIKGNAPVFRYKLLGSLTSIMLGFLESIEQLDQDVIEILDAHHKTLRAIVSKKLEGDGGPLGEKLQNELKDAIRRYFEKVHAQ